MYKTVGTCPRCGAVKELDKLTESEIELGFQRLTVTVTGKTGYEQSAVSDLVLCGDCCKLFREQIPAYALEWATTPITKGKTRFEKIQQTPPKKPRVKKPRVKKTPKNKPTPPATGERSLLNVRCESCGERVRLHVTHPVFGSFQFFASDGVLTWRRPGLKTWLPATSASLNDLRGNSGGKLKLVLECKAENQYVEAEFVYSDGVVSTSPDYFLHLLSKGNLTVK
jgi:hypothetical protein